MAWTFLNSLLLSYDTGLIQHYAPIISSHPITVIFHFPSFRHNSILTFTTTESFHFLLQKMEKSESNISFHPISCLYLTLELALAPSWILWLGLLISISCKQRSQRKSNIFYCNVNANADMVFSLVYSSAIASGSSSHFPNPICNRYSYSKPEKRKCVLWVKTKIGLSELKKRILCLQKLGLNAISMLILLTCGWVEGKLGQVKSQVKPALDWQCNNAEKNNMNLSNCHKRSLQC